VSVSVSDLKTLSVKNVRYQCVYVFRYTACVLLITFDRWYRWYTNYLVTASSCKLLVLLALTSNCATSDA